MTMFSDDQRNVIDKYKSVPLEEIRADLRRTQLPFEIAIENLERDFNMGTIVRTANAFNVKTVYIIGRKQWNKRGAMMTDKYIDLVYCPAIEDFIKHVKNLTIIAIDNVEISVPLSQVDIPRGESVLVFGSEANGISAELLDHADQIVAIEQFGSTRSLNVGVAAGIAMYEWVRKLRLHGQ